MTTPEERLRAHAEAIVRAGRVPGRLRDEVIEELLSHLLQRFRAHVGAGVDPETAAGRAMNEFGQPDALGRDMRGAFHGRFWASTIGTLIPVERAPGGRPAGIGWLAGLTTVGAVFAAAAAGITAVSSPPLHAILGLVAYGAAALALWFGAEALRNGQEWGYGVCVLTASGMLVQGIVDTLGAPGVHVAVLGWIAAGVLLWLGSNRPVVRGWLSQSRPISQRWGVAITMAVLATWATGPVLAALPDPTAAVAEDFSGSVSMTCTDAPVGPPEALFTATLEIRARRTSLLHGGLVRLGSPAHGIATLELPEDGYISGDGPSVVDGTTGRPLAEEGWWWDGPAAWQQAFNVPHVIPASALRSGGPIEIHWRGGFNRTDTTDTYTDVRFAYPGDIELRAWVACNERAPLVDVRQGR